MLINCGSLMRTTTIQVDHKPVVWIYDTELKEAKCFEVPIVPIDQVMDLELANTIKVRNKKLDEYMEHLSSDYAIDLQFEKTVQNIVKKNEVKHRTQAIIGEVFMKYYGEAA